MKFVLHLDYKVSAEIFNAKPKLGDWNGYL